ncbi:hypothetical protein [Desulfospira joergensenii]|uniref:hypothetical protein n=1 Tax=Desulfospira joergensenii TaxID=53329 RepID=UPI0003B508AD|nr:hypothetical protein [Desulfospira joergensenii]
MKQIGFIFFLLSAILFQTLFSDPLAAGEYEFAGYEARFRNFVTCELTRTGAVSPFKGKAFKITMIDLFDVRDEGDLTIVTGAVRCSVEDGFQVLYVALGVETLSGKEHVVYYTIREKDFTILATELMKFPYKERCPWTRYWIDLD